ncbi:MAG: helix-turn-helix domain-containing protein [Oscillospiraceae bacterium]|nr:helix-turn-helix domain-containing protein [Oscillospiraceae bacterium]
MNIANRIHDLRKAKGISQEEFAAQIGVSRQAVSKWESEQSLPEIEKVIIMSDYFEVTTDYILKGIQTKEQAREKNALDANVFLSSATFLIAIGLILACTIWHEKQTTTALAVGLTLMAMGCLNFGIGVANATKNVEKGKRAFWIVNIWLLSFIPLSLIYNALLGRVLAPYPLILEPFIAFIAFWLVYIALCLYVVSIKVRKKPQKG